MTGRESFRSTSTFDWAKERLANSRRLAAHRIGEDRNGWLDDVAYWEAIVGTFKALRDLLDAVDSGTRRGRCLDHLPAKIVDRARAYLLGNPNVLAPARGETASGREEEE